MDMDRPKSRDGRKVTHGAANHATPSDVPIVGIVASDAREELHLASAVRRAGGEPLAAADADASLDRVGGLVVSAAPQADEKTWGAGDWVSWALDQGRPVLATGGGFLALNVAAGGSMVEVDGHAADPGDEEPAYHRIYIAPGGKLAATVGSGGFVRVNSRHAFGVREAQKAPGLLATAYSLEDGVIEALESPEHKWVIGVQFDPQRRGELPPHFDRLFDSLVVQARARA